MTRRERMERRAEQRAEWTVKAASRASQRFDNASRAVEMIPFGQPILVGHYSERRHRAAIARCDSNMRAGVEAQHLAERHEQVAETLTARLETTIFSDDENAITALEARIAEREAARDRIKRYNVTCRKAAKAGEAFGDLSILDAAQKANLLSLARVCAYQLGAGGAYPSYALSNLSGNIKSDRDRIETIKRDAARRQAAVDNGGVIIRKRAMFDREWCSVTFAEKPSREILDALRGAGYQYSRGTWSGYADKFPLTDDGTEVRS